ncbi:taste receptor type 2 member 8-like [Heteronotia binoei]|uniref:taste receptor type 2 member 8-like n=1 Tax=Heteronotia binoei TaxID=13085 RepID=UPI00292D1336|nr:taste receptor type 2 member 8-like [Heteronotia binoei]
MAYLLLITGFTLLVTETLIGMITNGFIVLIICIDWFRSKKLSPTDLILGCLGVSRLMWQAIVIMKVTMTFFFKSTYIQNYIRLMFITMWLFTNMVSLWFAAWLSVMYFVKIAIFSQPVFLRVKQRFSGLVLWLLLGSVVFSAFMNIIIITASNYGLSTCNPYEICPSNCTDTDIKIPQSCKYFIILTTAPHFLPITIFLSSSLLLITSLWNHIRHLRCNGINPRDLSTQAHLTAIKSLMFFAILYLSSFVAVTSQSLVIWTSRQRDWTSIFFENVSAVYPAGHAIILILINPKLKQAWSHLLLKVFLPPPPPLDCSGLTLNLGRVSSSVAELHVKDPRFDPQHLQLQESRCRL